MKERLCFTIRANEGELATHYASRGLRFLGGPLLPAGERFVIALGVFDNFTVAKGQNTDAWTARPRVQIVEAAKDLLESIAKDQELLEYNYQYSFSSGGKVKNTGGMTVTVDGKRGLIDASRPGQVYLLMDEGTVHDLRSGQPFVTNRGVVKVHRRRNKIDWQEKLVRLVDYLESLESDTVQIRHHYIEGSK